MSSASRVSCIYYAHTLCRQLIRMCVERMAIHRTDLSAHYNVYSFPDIYSVSH
jgi:hypothetical protein